MGGYAGSHARMMVTSSACELSAMVKSPYLTATWQRRCKRRRMTLLRRAFTLAMVPLPFFAVQAMPAVMPEMGDPVYHIKGETDTIDEESGDTSETGACDDDDTPDADLAMPASLLELWARRADEALAMPSTTHPSYLGDTARLPPLPFTATKWLRPRYLRVTSTLPLRCLRATPARPLR